MVFLAVLKTGIYFSVDWGTHWHSLQCNLPITPVMDIQINFQEGDIVIATHGRSFWILDDASVLSQSVPYYDEIPIKNQPDEMKSDKSKILHQGKLGFFCKNL